MESCIIGTHTTSSYIYVPYDGKLKILSYFHGALNIENDSADGASVYWGHILVWYCFSMDLEVFAYILYSNIFI